MPEQKSTLETGTPTSRMQKRIWDLEQDNRDLTRQMLEAKIAAIQQRKSFESMQRFMDFYTVRNAGEEWTLTELYNRYMQAVQPIPKCGVCLSTLGQVGTLNGGVCPYCEESAPLRAQLEAMNR